MKKEEPKKANKELKEAIEKLIKDANAASDPKDRKQILDLVEKLYNVETDKAKVDLAEKRLQFDKRKLTQEDVVKLIQIFGVPTMGILALISYRILMETETAPDIFFRDIGKTILTLTGFKKV
jgi:hypothetical protein